MKENLIGDKTFEFGLLTIELYQQMMAQQEYVLSKQFLRAGTSIGSNVEEAIAGISRKDFIAKMSIASKEARETRYWIRLLDKSNLFDIDFNEALIEINSIINIITKIIKTSQSQ